MTTLISVKLHGHFSEMNISILQLSGLAEGHELLLTVLVAAAAEAE